jgi:hypothetical protein
MSKFAILKELSDIKAIAQRKSAIKRGALIAVASYLLLSYGQGAWSYLSTAKRLVTGKFQASVPLQFEIERAKTMITDLLPDVRQNMLLIAQEEVGVEDLRRQIAQGESELAKHRDELVSLRAKLATNEATVSLANRNATKAEVKDELTRRFSRYQIAESTLASQRQLLLARENGLDAARAKLASMLNAKRDFEAQVQNLQARLKTQQSRTITDSIEVDDSQVARCQSLLNDVRARLEVADRLFSCEGDLLAMTSAIAPSSEDIGEQIDRYFSPPSTGEVLVTTQQ